MIQGIFALNFEALGKQVGSGFAVFDNGKIRGGDAEFVYDGTYHCNESSNSDSISFTAKVLVQYYKGINLAIFGKMTRFPIELSGVFTADKLLAHGEIKKFGSEEVDLKGTKIDDLRLETLEINEWKFLDQNFNFEKEDIRHTLNSAFALYQDKCYVDATNLVFSLTKSIVFYLLEKTSDKNVQHASCLEEIDILVENGLISSKMKSLMQALAASDNVLNKKLNSPEDCAFPLCAMAFSLVDKLLSNTRINDLCQ
jgi:T3SS negative regulator,GrlR